MQDYTVDEQPNLASQMLQLRLQNRSAESPERREKRQFMSHLKGLASAVNGNIILREVDAERNGTEYRLLLEGAPTEHKRAVSG